MFLSVSVRRSWISTHTGFFFSIFVSVSVFFSLPPVRKLNLIEAEEGGGKSSNEKRRNEMVNWNFLGIIGKGKREKILK